MHFNLIQITLFEALYMPALLEKLALFGDVLLETFVRTVLRMRKQMGIVTLRPPLLFFGSRDMRRRVAPQVAVILLCTYKMCLLLLCFVLIELVKNKHRRKIKLAMGSQQGDAKAISEGCCCL